MALQQSCPQPDLKGGTSETRQGWIRSSSTLWHIRKKKEKEKGGVAEMTLASEDQRLG